MMAAARALPDPTQVLYDRLIARANQAGNAVAFAGMIATRCGGGGALPAWLGLQPAAFGCLLEHIFPGAASEPLPGIGIPVAVDDDAYDRCDERDEFHDGDQCYKRYKCCECDERDGNCDGSTWWDRSDIGFSS